MEKTLFEKTIVSDEPYMFSKNDWPFDTQHLSKVVIFRARHPQNAYFNLISDFHQEINE